MIYALDNIVALSVRSTTKFIMIFSAWFIAFTEMYLRLVYCVGTITYIPIKNSISSLKIKKKTLNMQDAQKYYHISTQTENINLYSQRYMY